MVLGDPPDADLSLQSDSPMEDPKSPGLSGIIIVRLIFPYFPYLPISSHIFPYFPIVFPYFSIVLVTRMSFLGTPTNDPGTRLPSGTSSLPGANGPTAVDDDE